MSNFEPVEFKLEQAKRHLRKMGSAEDYCPYCNRTSPGPMTDEHVITQSIGGDHRTVIRVCKTCNNDAGMRIDSRIVRHSPLRAKIWAIQNLMKLQEKHQSRGVLKDGTELQGCFYWIPVSETEVRIGFQPDKHQPNGSTWLHEKAVDPTRPPAGINVYREDMLDMASVCFSDPATAGLEPAMVKILLGMMYLQHGRSCVSQRGFDLMRACLGDAIPPQVSFNWIPSLDELRACWPFDVLENHHTIWGGCLDRRVFRGGVRLFHDTIVEVTIVDFVALVPEGAISIPLG